MKEKINQDIVMNNLHVNLEKICGSEVISLNIRIIPYLVNNITNK